MEQKSQNASEDRRRKRGKAKKGEVEEVKKRGGGVKRTQNDGVLSVVNDTHAPLWDEQVKTNRLGDDKPHCPRRDSHPEQRSLVHSAAVVDSQTPDCRVY